MNEEAQDVLRYWFDGDQMETYRLKWFPTQGSIKQQQTDREIAHRFGPLLTQAEAGELNSWRFESPETCVALILVLDQFSRHIYRPLQCCWL
ncbi:unnamed protein product [Peronospora belbahrii]|nr:unnamed protein product [Peronospora belbahrii]